MRRLARLVLAAVAAVALAACGTSAADVRPVGSASASRYAGAELTEPYTMPEATFTDQNGQKFDLRTGSDKRWMSRLADGTLLSLNPHG